jgi:FkbM family methyltransferase
MPTARKVYLDVGANNGSSMMHHAEDPDSVVYAFEPTPRLVAELRERAQRYDGRYVVVPAAVSDYDGRATFNVAGQNDWGCSSLRTFNDNLEETWRGREDFRVTESIEVDVIRLDGFIAAHGIEEIEHLHVDAQGCDLEVLHGLGDRLGIVRSGVIEMPSSHAVRLYKDQKYAMDDAVAFLEARGFRVSHIGLNDFHGACVPHGVVDVREANEVNVYFERA